MHKIINNFIHKITSSACKYYHRKKWREYCKNHSKSQTELDRIQISAFVFLLFLLYQDTLIQILNDIPAHFSQFSIMCVRVKHAFRFLTEGLTLHCVSLRFDHFSCEFCVLLNITSLFYKQLQMLYIYLPCFKID